MERERKTSGRLRGNVVFGGATAGVIDSSTGAMYELTPGAVDASMRTRTASAGGRRMIQVAIAMSPDPSWQKIGPLTRE